MRRGDRGAVEEPFCVARVFGDNAELDRRAARNGLSLGVDMNDGCREHRAAEPDGAAEILHVKVGRRQGIRRRRVTERLEWKREAALGEDFFKRGAIPQVPNFYLKENGCARADTREAARATNPCSWRSRDMGSEWRGRLRDRGEA